MIQHAFANRTDTLATWAVLQKNCLLVKAEEEREKRAREESLLSKRLRSVREAKKADLKPLPSKAAHLPESPTPPRPATASTTPPQSSSGSTSPLLAPSRNRETAPVNNDAPTSVAGLPGGVAPPTIRPEGGLRKSLASPPRPCWLTVKGSNRHINLPINGELVLGRFDPNLGIPPDIDLAYEDAGTRVISRRHAKIVGVDGIHQVEDLGSRHGVFINGEQVGFGPSRPLKPGDVIVLGNLKLSYDLSPIDQLNISTTSPSRHLLIVTATGQKIMIAPPNEIVLGRSDRYVDFIPDIDLKTAGDVAVRVSRRHAIISWRKNMPYVEDLGSGFGTRLNGEVLLLGQAKLLQPGDHIWLGGCVLAYDVEL
jgi:pSer/pThr/pTyr-binding forkhead associated (FHA) protein